MKPISLSIALVLASIVSLPTAASADGVDTYADQQCANGGWEAKGYPSYEECYAAAVDYYYSQMGYGGSGGEGGHSGGTFIGDIPGYEPTGDTGGCKTRACASQ